jgi:hypothetical protein
MVWFPKQLCLARVAVAIIEIIRLFNFSGGAGGEFIQESIAFVIGARDTEG